MISIISAAFQNTSPHINHLENEFVEDIYIETYFCIDA